MTITKIAAVLARGPVPIELDASEYWKLSTLVMEGDLLLHKRQIAYRTPVYPCFLAAVRVLAGARSLLAVVILQGVFAFGTLLIAASIASRATKLPSAFNWTLLISLPAISAFVFGAAVLSESLFVFLLMLNLLAVLDYAKHGNGSRAVWVGVTFAITLLTRPIAMLIWIPHLFFLLHIHLRKNSRLRSHHMKTIAIRRRLGHVFVAGLTTMAIVTPWLMRNQVLFGKPFITEFVGRNIWIVTFQDGSGAGLDLPKKSEAEELTRRLNNVGITDNWRHTWTVSKALVRSGLDDASADRLMKSVALSAARESPCEFGYKAFRRVVNFWRAAATELPPQTTEGSYFGQQTWSRSVAPIDWALRYRWSQSVWLNTLLLGGLVGALLMLIVNSPTRPYAIWIALILAYFSIVTGVLEIPAYRYRIVVEPLVAAAYGAAIAVLCSRRRKPAEVAG